MLFQCLRYGDERVEDFGQLRVSLHIVCHALLQLNVSTHVAIDVLQVFIHLDERLSVFVLLSNHAGVLLIILLKHGFFLGKFIENI